MTRVEIVFSRGDDIGGVQRFSVMLGELLESRGYDVALVYGGAADRISLVTNLECIYLRNLSRYSFVGFYLYLRRKKQRCVRILGSTAVGLGGLTSSSGSIFVFHGLASNYNYSYKMVLIRAIEKLIAVVYRYKVFLKAADLKQLGCSGGTIIPNFVDSDRFRPSTNRDIDALIVSRHSRQKMIRKMIDYCSARGFEEVVLLGDGPEYESNKLYAMSSAKVTSTKFTFIKFNATPEKYFGRAKYYIHFALSEGMPLAVLEAMSSACVVVLNDFPGAQELVRHGITGYIVDPDADEPTPDYDAKIGVEARMVVERDYNLSAFSDAYNSLVEKVMKK